MITENVFSFFHATHGTCEHELAAEQSCASSAAVRPLQSTTFCRFRYEKRLSLATKLLSWQQWGEPKPDGCCEWDACPNEPSESVFWFPKLKNPIRVQRTDAQILTVHVENLENYNNMLSWAPEKSAVKYNMWTMVSTYFWIIWVWDYSCFSQWGHFVWEFFYLEVVSNLVFFCFHPAETGCINVNVEELNSPALNCWLS